MADFSQTIYLLLGAVIYQGIYLMIPDTHPQARQIGAGLAAGGTLAAIIYARGGLFASAFSRSGFLVYCAVALVVSVALAVPIFSGFVLRRDAKKIATELEDWSILARAKLPRFVAAGWRSPEEAQLEAEYKDKFGARIVRLMKPLVAGDKIHTDLRDSWLRSGSPSLNVASTSHLASTFFQKYGSNELPIPIPRRWPDRAVLKSVALYFVIALALWPVFFIVGRVQPVSVVPSATAPPSSLHMAYSSHQVLSAAPEDYNTFLNLDNVASLYLSAPHGREEVTLTWPTSPAIATEHPKTEPGITVQGLRMLAGQMKSMTFDSAHPVYLIRVGNRIFQVQLISIDDKTTAQRPFDIEYSFAISEVEPTAENKANAITQSQPSATPPGTP